VFISQNGMIQRTGVKGISQQGRSATGVRLMSPRDGDQVSAIALIAESEDESGEPTLDVEGEELNVAAEPGDVSAPLPPEADDEGDDLAAEDAAVEGPEDDEA
jgi:DNA gyrase subunit A